MISAYLCLACVRLFHLHARQWVRRAPGIPCALYLLRDENEASLGRVSAAGMRRCVLIASSFRDIAKAMGPESIAPQENSEQSDSGLAPRGAPEMTTKAV